MVFVYILALLTPISIWWLVVMTRKSVRSQFRYSIRLSSGAPILAHRTRKNGPTPRKFFFLLSFHKSQPFCKS